MQIHGNAVYQGQDFSEKICNLFRSRWLISFPKGSPLRRISVNSIHSYQCTAMRGYPGLRLGLLLYSIFSTFNVWIEKHATIPKRVCNISFLSSARISRVGSSARVARSSFWGEQEKEVLDESRILKPAKERP